MYLCFAEVKFLEEESTAIVPVSCIQQKETLEFGGSCSILWSNKKVYKGLLICSGIQVLLMAWDREWCSISHLYIQNLIFEVNSR